MSGEHLQAVDVREVVERLEKYVAATRIDPPAGFVDRLRVAIDADHDLRPTLSAIPTTPVRVRRRRLTWRTRPGLLAAAALTTLLAGGVALGAAGGSLWPESDDGPVARSSDGPNRPAEGRTGVDSPPGEVPALPAADDSMQSDRGDRADEAPVPESTDDDGVDETDNGDDDTGTEEHQESEQADDADGEDPDESEAESESEPEAEPDSEAESDSEVESDPDD